MPRTVYEYERILTSVENQQILRSQGYTPVFSSNVSGIQRKGNDLYIRFHNASIYVYPNQGNRFNDLLLSPSKGKWVWRELRRKNVAYSQVGSLPLDGDLDLSNDEMMERIKEEGLLVQALIMLKATSPITQGLNLLGDNTNLLSITLLSELVTQ